MKTNLLFVNRKKKCSNCRTFTVLKYMTTTLATPNAGNVLKLCGQGIGGGTLSMLAKARKPIFGFCNQVRLKLVWSATETS